MNASEFGCGAGHQLAITAAKAGWELEDFSILQKSEKKCSQVLQFLRGEAGIVLKEKPPEPEVVIDPIIRVDRSVRPSYPDWVAMVMHPELENAGPSEYDIIKTEQWLHDGQKDGKWIEGNKIYTHLKETSDLKNHGTLRDLEEIQKKGIVFFRKYFASKAVFAWGSVVRSRCSSLYVPYFYENGGKVVLNWDWLGSGWYSINPGLRHAS